MSWVGDGSWDRKVLLQYIDPMCSAFQVKHYAARIGQWDLIRSGTRRLKSIPTRLYWFQCPRVGYAMTTKMAAFKYAALNSTMTQTDLQQNHDWKVSRCYLQDIAEEVAAIAEAKSEHWRYADPPLGGKRTQC